MYTRFKIFKQKCELIFAGPLEKVEEAKKMRLLLLWEDDRASRSTTQQLGKTMAMIYEI